MRLFFLFIFLCCCTACKVENQAIDFPKSYYFREIELAPIQFFLWTHSGLQPLQMDIIKSPQLLIRDPGFKIHSFYFENEYKAKLFAEDNPFISRQLTYEVEEGALRLWYPTNLDEHWYLEGHLEEDQLKAPFFQLWKLDDPERSFLRFQNQSFNNERLLLAHYLEKEPIFGFDTKNGMVIGVQRGKVVYYER